ncbi:MAG: TolC family protein, partial [Lentisphaeria bacterium]|nr:TolC family protein [Lentisphaeria bacterium]
MAGRKGVAVSGFGCRGQCRIPGWRCLLRGLLAAAVWGLPAGCRTPRQWREQADRAAGDAITAAQLDVLGRAETITVDSPADALRRRLLLGQDLQHSGPASKGIGDLEDNEFWRKDRHLPPRPEVVEPWDGREVIRPSLVEALQVAARNSREFQDAKDRVFRAALALDLERDEFRRTFTGMLSGLFDTQDIARGRRNGFLGEADGSVERRFRNGVELSGAIAFDLAKVLTQERSSALGALADVSITIPLLRGAGRRITEEPLRQAERNLLYAIHDFERFKQGFAVDVASEYLGILREQRRVRNQEDNYKRLVASSRRARRLSDSGRRQEFEFDQAVQNELRARENWISSILSTQRNLDRFKMTLGLPPDAKVELRDEELDSLAVRVEELTAGVIVADYSGEVPAADAPVELRPPGRESAGPLEMEEAAAVRIALACRRDLLVALAEVEDAQRDVMV